MRMELSKIVSNLFWPCITLIHFFYLIAPVMIPVDNLDGTEPIRTRIESDQNDGIRYILIYDSILGRVLCLAVMGDRKKGSQFVLEWNYGDKEGANVWALCAWYIFERVDGLISGNLLETQVSSHEFYSCQNYICSCPTPSYTIPGESNSLSLTKKNAREIDEFIKRM